MSQFNIPVYSQVDLSKKKKKSAIVREENDTEVSIIVNNENANQQSDPTFTIIEDINETSNCYGAPSTAKSSYTPIIQASLTAPSKYESAEIVAINQDDVSTSEPSEKNSCPCNKKLTFLLLLAIALFGILCGCIIFTLVKLFEFKSELAALSTNYTALSTNYTALSTNYTALSTNYTDLRSNLYQAREAIRALNVDQNGEKIYSLNQSLLALEADHQYFNATVRRVGQASSPAVSCADILMVSPSSPSGYYWIINSDGFSVHVYCDMTRLCGNITGGWMRVADIDVKNHTNPCPGNLQQRMNPSGVRVCGIEPFVLTPACSAINLNLNSIQYSRVCGKIKAYRFGSLGAFNEMRNDIDNLYVDGISLTHGRSPRRHIWTLAAATHINNCPCNNNTLSTPSFVGQDYFCDAAREGTDPLWSGVDCFNNDACCLFNNPPWFYQLLQAPSTDDIEMRVCINQQSTDIAIETVDLFVH